MRLIDADRLRKLFAPGSTYRTKSVFCKIDASPTIAAVPIKEISAWLAAYAAPPKYAIDEIARTDSGIITADTLVEAWEYHWKSLMECGLIGEGLDAKTD